jgi:hypothetical protein
MIIEAFVMAVAERAAGNVVASLVQALGRQLRDAAFGNAEQQALGRCVQAGLTAIGTEARCESEEALRHLLEEVFGPFFADPTVTRPLAKSLRGSPVETSEFRELFGELGFDTGTLMPGIEFEAALGAFLTGFRDAAADDATLRPLLAFGEQKVQTRLQEQIRDALRHEGHEAHYLNTLIKRCDVLDLSPIDETYPQGGRPGEDGTVGISDVFTALHLARLTRRPGDDLAALIRGEDRDRMSQEGREQPEPIPALEAIAAMPRLVVLGKPGGGKSSLVNYLAVQLARRRLREAGAELPGWAAGRAPLPVRIVLRQLAARLPEGVGQGDAGHVWDYVQHQLALWGCKEAYPALKRDLEAGGGIVFFDGLDEVSESDEAAKRSMIKDAIAWFAGALPNTQIVVTSREYAYRKDDAWRLPEGEFPVVELDLFGPSQVQAFVRAWYAVVGPWKGWDQGKAAAEAERLYRATQAIRHLRDLARYPLLLTLMARVHGRDGTLPEDRAELYKRAVELLLSHWENRLVRDESGKPKVRPGLVQRLEVTTEALLGTLERVAFAAHERQESDPDGGARAADIPREDLRDELGTELKSVDKADQAIAYIRRARLLKPTVQTTPWRGSHRPMQPRDVFV